MSFKQVVKQTMVHPCHGIILGNQKEQTIDKYNNNDESLENYNDWKKPILDFPGGTVVKNPPASAGDMRTIPGLGRSHMLRSN